MACATRTARYVFVSGERNGRGGGGRRLQLMLPPFEEVGIGFDDDDERHVRVLRSAIFGALPAEDAGLRRNDRDVVVAARDEVLLAAEARHPEAVDHVARIEEDACGNTDRKVKLVRG